MNLFPSFKENKNWFTVKHLGVGLVMYHVCKSICFPSAMKRVRYDKQRTAMFSLNVVHEYFIASEKDERHKRDVIFSKAVK